MRGELNCMHPCQCMALVNLTDVNTSSTTSTPTASRGDTGAAVITGISVTIVIVVVAAFIVLVVVVLVVKRFTHSKVVLQVTGDSLDIAGQDNHPSIVLHK